MGKDARSLPLSQTILDRDLARYLAKQHGCRTIGDVAKLNHGHFVRCRGFGEPTRRCINRALSFHGLPEIPNDLEISAK